MNQFDGIDYDAITAAVTAAVDTHTIHSAILDVDGVPPCYIFFVGDDRPSASPLIYAHRNGDGMTFAQLKTGGWRLTKFWGAPEQVNKSPTKFERTSLDELVDLVSARPKETLQFLPKEITGRQRKVVFREHMLDMWWKADTFHLRWYGGDAPITSDPFEGKPWESEPAVEWCKKMLPSIAQDKFLARVNLEAAERFDRAVGQELEEHPGAFMF
jgi:hypothetical protein